MEEPATTGMEGGVITLQQQLEVLGLKHKEAYWSRTIFSILQRLETIRQDIDGIDTNHHHPQSSSSPGGNQQSTSFLFSNSTKTLNRLYQSLKSHLTQHQLREKTLENATSSLTESEQSLEALGMMEVVIQTCHLLISHTISRLITSISSLPDYVTFWKTERQRFYVLQKLEAGPFEWFKPRSRRIQVSERLRALHVIFELNLEKIGKLKHLEMTLLSSSTAAVTTLNSIFSELHGILDHTSLACIHARRGYNLPPGSSNLPSSPKSNQNPIALFDFSSNINTLSTLVRTMEVLKEKHDRYSRVLEEALIPCEPPSKLRRKWAQVSLSIFVTSLCVLYLQKNRERFNDIRSHVTALVSDFLKEHMIDPVSKIIQEVVFNKKPEIQDAAALDDTITSLQRMLDEFILDTQPSLPVVERKALAQSMDMSCVSLTMEKQIPKAMKNILSGDIVRMLLIQVQFIKKELMVAMGSIDDLMHANEFNMQMMATFPTFIITGGLYYIVKELASQFYLMLSPYSHPRRVVYQELRNVLRDIERLLNRQQGSLEGYTTSLVKEEPPSSVRKKRGVLSMRDLGRLVVMLHRIQLLFKRHETLFEKNVMSATHFQQDLQDLVDEDLLVPQKLATINRMYHSHKFLTE